MAISALLRLIAFGSATPDALFATDGDCIDFARFHEAKGVSCQSFVAARIVWQGGRET